MINLTVPFYDFCGFRSVAVNNVYKLQFFYIYSINACHVEFLRISASNQLVLIGLHTKPTDAVDEMEALIDVHAAVEQHWNTNNILIMGDLNADCSYASKTALQGLTLRTDPRFSWLIGDDVDTTTTSTDCAYDRCVWRGIATCNKVGFRQAVG